MPTGGFSSARETFSRKIQVEVHLARVLVTEGADLEIDGYEATQATMEEQKAYEMMAPSHCDAILPSQEGEVAAKLQQKFLEVIDHGTLQIGLRVCLSFRQAKNLEHVRVAHVRCRRVEQPALIGKGEHGLSVTRQADALEQH
jgi:hypothetical protein